MTTPVPRRTLLPLAAGAVALAALVWSAGRASQRASAAGVRESRPEDPPGACAPEAAAAGDELGAPELVASEPPPARTSAEPGRVPVRGTLVLLDGDGREHLQGSGHFELAVWGASLTLQHAAELGPAHAGQRERLRRRQVTTVRVEDGRFEALLPAHDARRAANGWLDGRPLFGLEVLETEDGDPERLALRVTGRALFPARMSVVDSETGRELEDVSVVSIEPSDPRLHPGDLPATITDAASPLEIPALAGDRRSYLVGAPEHAWRRVEWNHDSAAFRVVELERAGAVVIDVDADCPLADCVLVLETSGGAACARLDAAAPLPRELSGVAPGAYRVALVPRASLVEAQVPQLADTALDVVAGGVAVAELHVRLGERPEPVLLAGSIRMSPSWSRGGPHLVLRALGRSALWHMHTDGLLGGVEVERQDDRWSFRSAQALAGATYLLTERRTGFVRAIEVGPRGLGECRLEIPDPVAVRVEVVDRLTGAPIPESGLAWLPPGPAGVPHRVTSQALWIQPTERAGVFHARVPGWERLEFEAHASGYRAEVGTLLTSTGPASSMRIALERE